ncbi:hypothetical protein N5J44_09740 [Acinetobacter ursingii]|uniref:Uncharacterized protein n=1 Tax=Acinetobacter ursingii TaxID=108980 RepID=A0AA46PM57_9GAMM|nr:hypothetical protein [Acinetobacter ursingii]MCU4603435.1 hypothetical protein [Acinetobacter ursingii]MDH2019442.1 hypothetical protein [Acinetobacter ursingii]MDH2071820.1 hypothetical protein [Acinetobacter ursingii]UYF76520.1 hypothetical protein LSO58_06505 [Acinetobacter ursingii]
MKTQTSRQCLICNCSFTPLPQHPNQKYCPNQKCKKEGKAIWYKNKMQTDPDYPEMQAIASKKWWGKNPDYQRNRRKRKKDDNNIDLSKSNLPIKLNLKSKIYLLTILESTDNMDLITIKLEALSNS